MDTNNSTSETYSTADGDSAVTSSFDTIGSTDARVDTFGASSNTGSGSGQGSSYRTTQEVRDQAQQKTGEVIDQAKAKTGEVVGQVQQQAKSQLSIQKDRAAEGLGSVSQALRQTGDQLRQGDNAPVAQYTDKVAEQVDRVSTFLRERDINQIVNEVEHYARRQPAVFLGGAFALGLLAARFLKSSGQQAMRQDTNYSSYGYNNTFNRGEGSVYGRGSYGSSAYDSGYSSGYGTGSASGTYLPSQGVDGSGISGTGSQDIDQGGYGTGTLPGSGLGTEA